MEWKYVLLTADGDGRDLSTEPPANSSLAALLKEGWTPVRETALGTSSKTGKGTVALLVLQRQQKKERKRREVATDLGHVVERVVK